MKRTVGVFVVLWAVVACGDATERAAESPVEAEEVVEAEESAEGGCRESDPLRDAFFGELHVHTRYSMDAYSWDVRATPDDAYRFAMGEPILLPPLDADGIRVQVPLLEKRRARSGAADGPACPARSPFSYDFSAELRVLSQRD